MRIKVLLSVVAALGAFLFYAQATHSSRRKTPGENKPECSAGAICFGGEVSRHNDYIHSINKDMNFVLAGNWTIEIVPFHPEGNCHELASVVNAPYRQHRELYIDTSYGWTAEEEVKVSPREFRFVTNCADFRAEAARLDIVLWGYNATEQQRNEALAKLGSSARGRGRMWITGSKISHAGDTPDNKLGTIEWMRFFVELRLQNAAELVIPSRTAK